MATDGRKVRADVASRSVRRGEGAGVAQVSNESGSRGAGRNLAWEELPPKRRRFYLWLFLVFFFGALPRIPLEMAGLPTFMATLIVAALTAVMLIPLGWAAGQEWKQRRASGEEPPPVAVKGRTVVAWVVTTLLFWCVAAFAVAESSGPFIPLLPMFCTFIAGRRFLQWRRQSVDSAG